ncbi:pirin-like C-terminal cupin domain-containing protein [Bacillus cihuensis]|uniref:pirin-like C-terminal cupin domain-containing protein n=1 Tax=Bacillus cihuensis TaxID=1208599 RepID=UPI0038991B69
MNFSKNTSIEIEVNERFELGLYGVLGRLIVDNKNIQTGELAVLSSGIKITISSQSDEAIVALIGGEKIKWKIYF